MLIVLRNKSPFCHNFCSRSWSEEGVYDSWAEVWSDMIKNGGNIKMIIIWTRFGGVYDTSMTKAYNCKLNSCK